MCKVRIWGNRVKSRIFWRALVAILGILEKILLTGRKTRAPGDKFKALSWRFRKNQKILENLYSYKQNKDHLHFAAFLALMNFTYRFVLCLGRRVFGKFTNFPDRFAAPLAGFLAGFCIKIYGNKAQRNFIAC